MSKAKPAAKPPKKTNPFSSMLSGPAKLSPEAESYARTRAKTTTNDQAAARIMERMRSGRKQGKRSNADYKQMGVYLPAELNLEFDILCRRKGLEKSEAVERLVRGFVDGKFSV